MRERNILSATSSRLTPPTFIAAASSALSRSAAPFIFSTLWIPSMALEQSGSSLGRGQRKRVRSPLTDGHRATAHFCRAVTSMFSQRLLLKMTKSMQFSFLAFTFGKHG